jgi:hypothetical protein
LPVLRQRARELTAMRRVNLPTFVTRAYAVRADAPPAANTAPVLTDDYAPVDGLLQNGPAVASGDQRRRPAPAGAGR